MDVLLFVHVKVAPGDPEKGDVTGNPPQTVTLGAGLMVGGGPTVIVKFWVTMQLPTEAVTAILPVVLTGTFAAVNEIFPVPLAPNPIAGLEFVQEITGLPVLEKKTSTCSPEQTLWLGGSSSVGTGLTVTVWVIGVPTQPLREGVTTKLIISWVVTGGTIKLDVNGGRYTINPSPHISPLKLSLVQVIVAPIVPG